MPAPSKSSHVERTQFAYLFSYILYTPFWGIYNLLPFILHKDLQATAFQVALLITLKPVVSLFSPYWSTYVSQRKDRLKKNIILANILGNLPFFLYPWVQNVWFFIASAALFMLLARGVVPAWMEVLKLNLSSQSRNRTFALGSTICYAISGIIPLLYGFLMDSDKDAWRWIFPLTAFISLTTIWLQLKLPISSVEPNPKPIPKQTQKLAFGLERKLPRLNDRKRVNINSIWTLLRSFNHGVLAKPKYQFLNLFGYKKEPILKYLVKPWKEAFHLLRNNRSYSFYQLGFMITGFGVMLWQPALPSFLLDTLNLSYTELAAALALCKGIGYTLSSPLWAKTFDRSTIFQFYGFVSALFCLFPLLLMFSTVQISLLYLAYILYGITQSASEMSWSLSGPLFASEKEDSSVYSNINILSVGLRGCIAPPLGAYLLGFGGSYPTMLLGGIFCLIGAIHLTLCAKKESEKLEHVKV